MENNKRTQGEWIALEIGKNEWVIKEKSLPNGYSDRIAELYQYNAKANAKFICKAVNNYDKLKEEKEYAEKEGKRLSDVATQWQKECKSIKEDNGLLKIDCDHTKVLLTSCESSLEKRNTYIDKLKEDNAILLEALKQIYNFIGVADNTRDTAMRAWAIKAIKKAESK